MNDFSKDFYLEEGMDFLNNGSFGACPKQVLENQNEWRLRMESQLIRFFMRELPIAMRDSARMLGDFIGAQQENIAFVENATSGANTVIRSLMPSLNKGDVLLTTSHCYGAVLSTLRYACDCTGAELVIAEVPFPIESKQQVVEILQPLLTEKVKLLTIDHVTSTTGLIFPIEEMIVLCKERGVPIFVDGAHAPGMLPLELEKLDADWYTGNCHKWMFAPKGCAFLWTHPDKQLVTHPTVISHLYQGGYIPEFDFVGTKDYTPFLTLPAAIEYFNAIGYEKLYKHNNTLVLKMRDYLCTEWEVQPPAPSDMIGYLATMPCPVAIEPSVSNAKVVHDYLWDNHRIEIPVMYFNNELFWRISAQIFNNENDYRRLCEAGKELRNGINL